MTRFQPALLAGSLAAALLLQPGTLLAQSDPAGRTGASQEAAPPSSEASQEAPESLTIDDYALWRSIGSVSLSDDGRWMTYGYSKRETDDTLFVRDLDAGTEHRIERASDPEFSPDGRWVAYFVSVPFEEAERLRERREPVPRKVELLDLDRGEKRSWENAASFDFAPGEGAVLAVKKTKADRDAEHDGTDLILRYLDRGYEEPIGSVDEFAFNERGSHLAYTTDTPDKDGNGLFLVRLTDGARLALDNGRADYARLTWADEEFPDPERVARGRPAGSALAILRGEEAEGFTERVNALLAFTGIGTQAPRGGPLPQPRRFVLDPDAEADEGSPAGFPEGWVLSERGSLEWSPDLSRVFVAIKKQKVDPETICKKAESDSTGTGPGGGIDSGGSDGDGPAGSGPPGAESAGEGEGGPVVSLPGGTPRGPGEIVGNDCPEFVADVDIWHVGDERLQSVQMVQANRDRNRTYEGVVHLDPEGGRGDGDDGGETGSTRFVQLSDEGMGSIDLTRDGRWGIGESDTAYVHDWLPRYGDYYRVDVETGARILFLERQLRTLGLSPDGEHFLYWKDGQVWDYEIEADEHRNLTAAAPVDFTDMEEDHFGEKPPYGVAGWTEEGDAVILRHRYDLFLQPLDGSPARSLTGGYGTENEIRFSIVELDRDEAQDGVDLDEPLLLSAFGQWSKKDGYFRLDDGELEPVVFEEARFGRLVKAEEADRVLFTKETFESFPDYWVSNLDFEAPEKITDANPQQGEYLWGSRILFDYYTEDGVRLQGTLAIPDDYVAGERRPMLVHFYEKLSQNLHDYPAPRYASSPMYAGYVSNGYLVLEPDIHFRTGPSHQHMLESIELAVEKVVEMGYADPERIGLHGHSYSGQGSAYISTHSDLFAAIVAGAAATNLVSDFNQLWKSAGTNQHRYDTYGQGRFATNPFDDLDLYMDQSATFNARDMNTPLMLMHGTEDGSVEWLQAVEFYNALRFNEKNVILLSYPGEGHGLREYENQKDFQIRMRQFFDHYLKGLPAPRWMTEGRTFLDKERALAAHEGKGGGGSSGNGGGRR